MVCSPVQPARPISQRSGYYSAHSRPRQRDPPVAEIIPLTLREPCPDCGGAMRIIETFRRGQKPQIPRTTQKGRRMTRCPSKWIIPAPLCASLGWSILLRRTNQYVENAPMLIVINAKIMPPMALSRLKCIRQTRQGPNQPTAASHFPHRSHSASHGFLLERFVNAGQSQSRAENSRNGPHRKTFIQADLRTAAQTPVPWKLECQLSPSSPGNLAPAANAHFPPFLSEVESCRSRPRADFQQPPRMLRCGPSKRPLVHG